MQDANKSPERMSILAILKKGKVTKRTQRQVCEQLTCFIARYLAPNISSPRPVHISEGDASSVTGDGISVLSTEDENSTMELLVYLCFLGASRSIISNRLSFDKVCFKRLLTLTATVPVSSSSPQFQKSFIFLLI